MLLKYKTFIYDIEVFKEDWLVIFKDYDTKEYTIIENNNYKLKQFLKQSRPYILCGFNNKWYDDWVITTMYNGGTNYEVKKHNDWIISGENGWAYPFIKGKRKPFMSMDLRDDLPLDLSLKEIEGNLYMNIKESDIPFDIDRKLTKDEMDETIRYCMHDVNATEKLFEVRDDYLQAKKTIAEMDGLSEMYALSLTNARLTAVMLKAQKVNRSIEDVRNYEIPDVINLERVPNELLEFFDKVHQDDTDMEKLLDPNKKIEGFNTLTINLAGTPCIYGYGGCHGANGKESINNDEKLILNYDVTSLYPSSMINFHYLSRNVDDPTRYSVLLDKRKEAKKEENEIVSKALKLPLNTTYGAQGQSTNDLYDPLMAKSVCITNQLAMTDLAVGLIEACPSFEMHNFNTDGIMFSIYPEEKPKALEVIEEWEKRTGFGLEEDNIKRYISKDVNNYFMEKTNGKIKAKGGWLGRYKGGDFKKNSMIIVQKAMVQYLIDGTSIAQTINECDDIRQFQIIAKTGSKYQGTYHWIDGEPRQVQRVNRVYATNDMRYGTIKKFKVENGKDRFDTIADLPEHCIVDNENKLSIDDLDKNWYIQLAEARMNKFIKEDTMAETKTTTTKAKTNKTIYQKLAQARLDFIKSGIKKTGKNKHLSFMYFTLDDIVPTGTKVLADNGLTKIDSFDIDGYSVSTVYDDEGNSILFRCPFEMPNPIFNKDGVEVNNRVQDLGSAITYIRRYLWMIVLDITENDGIDGDEVVEIKPKETPKQAPKTEVEKKEIKKEVMKQTDDKPCNKVTRNAIVKGLKALQEKDVKKYAPFIKENLTLAKDATLTMKQAQDLLAKINDMMEE